MCVEGVWSWYLRMERAWTWLREGEGSLDLGVWGCRESVISLASEK